MVSPSRLEPRALQDVCDENRRKTKRTDNFVRAGGARVHQQHIHYITSNSIMIVIPNLPSLALKIQMRATIAIQTKCDEFELGMRNRNKWIFAKTTSPMNSDI